MRQSDTIIVIPTRDRSDLAPKAIESVLTQSGCDVDVLVSDNSTSTEQRVALSKHCASNKVPRLHYVVPPEPLPMPQHWDWAMQRALSQFKASHVVFLSDRMMFKPGALASLLAIVKAYPEKIVSYMHDMVDDFSSPAILHQYTWSGNLYEVFSARLLELSAQSVMYDSSMPRMLNCIVPRALLNTIRQRFGTIFASIACDWNFCYRALDTVDSILFYDKALLVHSAQKRSNGQSAHHGVDNEAYKRFKEDLGSRPLNYAAPFPEVITVWNAIVSEYCQVKQVTKSPKFPELDRSKYIEALTMGIESIKDPPRQEYMREVLSTYVSQPQDPFVAPSLPPVGNDRAALPRRGSNRFVSKMRNGASTLARRFFTSPSSIETHLPEEPTDHVESFSVNSIEFQTSEDALSYALNHPRERAGATDQKTLIGGVAVPLPKRIQN